MDKKSSQGVGVEKKAIGIVVEYNPFHNGHLYHLNSAKKMGDIVIAVMSGNFTQRGDPSIIDKNTKTQMALDMGVDIVVDLPPFYSTQSAEIFGKGSIGILDILKCENILFGSECDDIKFLEKIASYQESTQFKDILKSNLKLGKSYPTAHSNAMKNILGDTKLGSNDILGLEYLKAIKYWKSNIKPILLARKHTKYYDMEIKKDFASATKIRHNIKNSIDYHGVVPVKCYEILKKYKNFTYLDDFYHLIRYEFIKNYKNLDNIQDMEIGFNNRIHESAKKFHNFSKFFNSISNKRYTQGRVQRVLLHSLLGLTTEMTSTIKLKIPYVLILGFNENGQKYLSSLKKEKKLDFRVISSYKNMNRIFDDTTCNLINFSRRCDIIYSMQNVSYVERPVIKV